MSVSHGERNEELSKTLLSEGTYVDWAVTTSFYSALHFVEYKLFAKGDCNCPYASLHAAKSALGYGWHKTRSVLVTRHLSALKGKYKYLYDSSRLARYNRYNINPTMAEKCHRNLDAIKAACT